jgi:thioredoxin reductase (NADPH)
MQKTEIIIIGSGPAGMMAAIYAKRTNREVILLDKNAAGGRLHSTYEVDNYLGFGKVTAQELVDKMVNHLYDLGINVTYGAVKSLRPTGKGFIIETETIDYQAEAVIIATGTNAKELGAENERKFLGKGVSYCAVCDANFYQGEDVVVIGGGDSALEESLYLNKMCRKVTIVHDLEEFTAIKGVVDRVKEHPQIKCYMNTKVIGFYGNEQLQYVKLQSLVENNQFELPVSGAFIYVGNRADCDFIQDFNVMDREGFIKVNQDMKTKVSGLFACGDVTKKDYRFIVTAISDGAIAALSAVKHLDKLAKTE